MGKYLMKISETYGNNRLIFFDYKFDIFNIYFIMTIKVCFYSISLHSFYRLYILNPLTKLS